MDIDFGDVDETTGENFRKTHSYKAKKYGTVNRSRQSLSELSKKDTKTILINRKAQYFKQKAKSIGFSSEECQKLVSLYGGLL